MRTPSRETIKRYKDEYPEGTRIKLLSMDDYQAPPVGTKGTVQGVDDMGDLLVHWDNGSSLSVILNVDRIEKINEN